MAEQRGTVQVTVTHLFDMWRMGKWLRGWGKLVREQCGDTMEHTVRGARGHFCEGTTRLTFLDEDEEATDGKQKAPLCHPSGLATS